MSTCQMCLSSFVPQRTTWEPDVCGECIASEIEMRLLGGLGLLVRKPAKRAVDDQETSTLIEFDVQSLPRAA